MTAHKRVLLSWSSGKDSAWSLQQLRQDPGLEVVGLLTTLNQEFDRVAMHAVRRELLQRQAEAAGVDAWLVDLPYPCSNQQYEEIMGRQIEKARAANIDAIAFGDLFLEDIRLYRERQMAGTGIELLFPLWLPARVDAVPGSSYELRTLVDASQTLARQMQSGGLRAFVTCVNPKALDASFAGREWDAAFLRDLPPHIDPCGENGEFHTFVFAGPMLQHEIAVQAGEIVTRDGYVFADLLPA